MPGQHTGKMSRFLPFFVLTTIFLVETQSKQPHILFVLVDDWGWANVGYHRDPPTREVDTPNIDSLKNEGLELDQHYVYKFCSPTRSSLISGRLPIHVNDKNNDIRPYNPNDPVSGFAGIPRNMTGIAEQMRKGGYTAHQVGKWHAGGATPDHLPTGRGFETSLGYLNGVNNYYTEIVGKCGKVGIVDLWDTDKPATGMNGTGLDNYEESLFVDRVMSILDNHDASKPLYLFYAPHLVHDPLQVPEKYLNMYKFIDYEPRQIYHAMVKYLDDVFGNITKMLKNKGMWDDLLLIVSSDNGGPIHIAANNFPLKGGKFSDWQGGIRANAFISGGYLPKTMKGKKTEEYIHIADWYATLCFLAGVDPTDDKAAKANLPPIDSLNMWPLISGQNSTSPRSDIPISFKTLISGDYKIITDKIGYSIWTGPQYPNATTNRQNIHVSENCNNGCLFNIKQDPNEYENLAEKMPSILKSMQSKLSKQQATYFNPSRGEDSSEACNTALNKYNGFWGPFVF
jgi:arylsulfatase I/J